MKRMSLAAILATTMTGLTATLSAQAEETKSTISSAELLSQLQNSISLREESTYQSPAPTNNSYFDFKQSLRAEAPTENERSFEALLEKGKDYISYKQKEVSFFGMNLYDVKFRLDYDKIDVVEPGIPETGEKTDWHYWGIVIKGKF